MLNLHASRSKYLKSPVFLAKMDSATQPWTEVTGVNGLLCADWLNGISYINFFTNDKNVCEIDKSFIPLASYTLHEVFILRQGYI